MATKCPKCGSADVTVLADRVSCLVCNQKGVDPKKGK